MIHARIDAVTTKNVVGFECGTRGLFDRLHGGDPLWIFVDYDVVEYRIDKIAFFADPRQFYFDAKGILRKRYVYTKTTIQDPISVYLTDNDGTNLTDTDGTYLTEPFATN